MTKRVCIEVEKGEEPTFCTYLFLAMWLWTSHLCSASFSFLTSKMEVLIPVCPTSRVGVGFQRDVGFESAARHTRYLVNIGCLIERMHK